MERNWESKIKTLGDDFCIKRRIISDAIKKAKESSLPDKCRDVDLFRYETARRILMKIIMVF